MSQDSYAVVAEGQQYFLKVYRRGRRSPAEIRAEVAFLTHLAAEGLPVARPVGPAQRANPMTILAWEGTRYAVLFEHAPGASPNGPLDPELAADYGRLLARLHQTGDRFPGRLARPALDLAFLLDQPMAALTRIWAENRDYLEAARQLANGIRLHLQAIPTVPPLHGPCHGDFILANSHVTAQGQITFFDFDHCGPGWRAYDIALFLQESGRWEPGAGQAFLAGYQDLRTLDDLELASLPYFQAARALFFLGAHASRIDEWGSARLSPDRVDAVLLEAKTVLSQAG